jgi:hypothetical protein
MLDQRVWKILGGVSRIENDPCRTSNSRWDSFGDRIDQFVASLFKTPFGPIAWLDES